MNQQMSWLTLILFGFCLTFCSKFPLRKYYYVDKSLTWYEAQQYCREHYTDLATFESMDDINRLEAPFSYRYAWIGLWDDPNSWKHQMGNESNSWRWSATGETSKTGYQSWGPGDPDFKDGKETCVMTSNEGAWYDKNCEHELNFICYIGMEQNVKQYEYISDLKTWGSAQTYCRTHYTDLATIENEAENLEVNNIIPEGVKVWIGLYRIPFLWSDKSASSFQNEHDFFYDNIKGVQHCVLEYPSHGWNDEACNKANVFVCQQVVKMTTTVKMAAMTGADLTDPDISAQVLQQVQLAGF
uniref:C-type lectin domain-containing protein n=1 Tax=Cyprinodon variegatus TaxID=28743 RepID=A0A3Q2EJR6_CYPVA